MMPGDKKLVEAMRMAQDALKPSGVEERARKLLVKLAMPVPPTVEYADWAIVIDALEAERRLALEEAERRINDDYDCPKLQPSGETACMGAYTVRAILSEKP